MPKQTFLRLALYISMIILLSACGGGAGKGDWSSSGRGDDTVPTVGHLPTNESGTLSTGVEVVTSGPVASIRNLPVTTAGVVFEGGVVEEEPKTKLDCIKHNLVVDSTLEVDQEAGFINTVYAPVITFNPNFNLTELEYINVIKDRLEFFGLKTSAQYIFDIYWDLYIKDPTHKELRVGSLENAEQLPKINCPAITISSDEVTGNSVYTVNGVDLLFKGKNNYSSAYEKLYLILKVKKGHSLALKLASFLFSNHFFGINNPTKQDINFLKTMILPRPKPQAIIKLPVLINE